MRDDEDLHKPERSSELESFQENIVKANELRQDIYDELCRLYRALGRTKMPDIKRVGKINEVGIVQEASKTLHRLGRMTSSVHVELQYRVLSGFVHNCYWASQTGATATETENKKLGDYTRSTASIEGNPRNILNAAKTAVSIGELAMKRYRLLSLLWAWPSGRAVTCGFGSGLCGLVH